MGIVRSFYLCHLYLAVDLYAVAGHNIRQPSRLCGISILLGLPNAKTELLRRAGRPPLGDRARYLLGHGQVSSLFIPMSTSNEEEDLSHRE